MNADPSAASMQTSNVASGQRGDLQVLTFFVNGDEYAVDILSVQEIRSWAAPMPIPHAPSFVKGVINIRGEIVPIVDLRSRLGFPEGTPDATTVIVVMRDQSTVPRVLGVVVDAMSDVANVVNDMIKPSPVQAESGVTMGIIAMPDKMIGLLNPDLLLPVRKTAAQ
jgi:purine-binding chemotaxis protein CheW